MAERVQRTRLATDFCPQKISPEENQMLTTVFSEEEIRVVVNSFDNSKSPRPDRFNFGFLKDFWEEMKGDFIRMFEESHEHGKIVNGLNLSFIVLIQRKKKLSVYLTTDHAL